MTDADKWKNDVLETMLREEEESPGLRVNLSPSGKGKRLRMGIIGDETLEIRCMIGPPLPSHIHFCYTQ